MPRPPVIELINWEKIFEKSYDYNTWIKNCEFPEHRDKIEERKNLLSVEPQIKGFLSFLERPVYVIAFAEDWCGDVIRHVPVLQKLSELTENLKIRYLKREQSLETFVRFLTNGGEAIPKFIFLSYKFVECGNWGPMSYDCREIIARGKACGDLMAARKRVSAMYEADQGCKTVIKEMVNLIDIASAVVP